MNKKINEVKATSAIEALRWIVENEHHEGYARPEVNPKGLVLVGNNQQLFIPKGMTADLLEPSDFSVTKRMFEPSAAGRALLNQASN